MREAPPKYRRLSPGERFNFSCHKGLPCFATCCSNVNIFLTPYDVLRMKKALGLPSWGFLIRYTLPRLMERGLPTVILKMEGEKKLCPFVAEGGCRIYNDRPWSCRMFPLTTRISETGEEEYLIMEEETCLGFKGERSWTIEEWKKDQGVEPYDIIDKSYRQITFHEYFKRGKRLKPSEAKIFYLACYNLDIFKRFLFESRFFDIYDVEPEVIERIKEDEEELLKFGFRYLRANFFWDETLRFKDKAMAELWETRRRQESGLS